MIQLNYRDARPIYEQVRDGLRHLVVTGALQAGDKLPSVRALVSSLAINPNTIQRAYESLEQEGYLCRCPDPRDGRAKLIHSTEKAIHIKDDVAALENEYYDWLLQGLSPEERESFERQLRRLMQRAREGRRCCYSQLHGEDGHQCS